MVESGSTPTLRENKNGGIMELTFKNMAQILTIPGKSLLADKLVR